MNLFNEVRLTARSWQITSFDFTFIADRVGGGKGEGGDRTWVKMLVVPFRGQNQ